MESVATPIQGAGFHTVARGETLWSIAQRYGVSVEELARLNRLDDSSRIKVGERLLIPMRHSPSPLHPSASFPASIPKTSLDGFVWPVDGTVIALFGTYRAGRINKGIEIQAPMGLPVVATRSGRVSFVSEAMPGLGKTIIVDHGDGFVSVYGYVGEILVKVGDWVAQRQVIARVGKTGRSEVPSLHFEIRYRQKPTNPLHYLP